MARLWEFKWPAARFLNSSGLLLEARLRVARLWEFKWPAFVNSSGPLLVIIQVARFCNSWLTWPASEISTGQHLPGPRPARDPPFPGTHQDRNTAF